MFRLRMVLFGACMISPVTLLPLPATAGDGLIWAPAKIGRNAYDLKVGAAVSVPWELRGGARFNISANQAGRLNRPQRPVNLWGMFSTPSSSSSSLEKRRGEMSVDFNTMSGRTYLQFKSTRTHMLTPAVDIETSQSIAAVANAYHASHNVLDASAETRLMLRGTGTAFRANGTLGSNRDHATGSLGVEQSLTPHLRLSVRFSRTDDGPKRSLGARYSISW